MSVLDNQNTNLVSATTSSPKPASPILRSKIRDSCESCASSKVKCSKEKPSCSRCESRGVLCQYLFTRRPGRRRETGLGARKRPSADKDSTTTTPKPTSIADCNVDGGLPDNSSSIHVVQTSQQQTSVMGRLSPTSTSPPPVSTKNNDYLTRLAVSTASPAQANTSTPSIDSPSIFSANVELDIYHDLAGFVTDMGSLDFPMSGLDSSFGLPSLGTGSTTNFTNPTPDHIASLLIPADGTKSGFGSSETSSAADLLSASSEASSLSTNHAQAPSIRKPDVTHAHVQETTSCSCLTQAVDLFKKLSVVPSSSPRAMSLDPASGAKTRSSKIGFGPADAVIMENNEGIESVTRMLECSSCALDGFLLNFIYMTLLKILGRYAAVTRTQPHEIGAAVDPELELKQRRLSTNMTSGPLGRSCINLPCQEKNGPDTGMAARLVLGELHRVQRVVNLLSPKLKSSYEEGPQADSNRVGVDLDWRRRNRWNEERSNMCAPLSNGTLEQMDNDARRNLSTLSTEIINMLRQS